jgi:hypothetical protein
LEEINGDLLEADFWPVPNFRFACAPPILTDVPKPILVFSTR